VGDDDNDNDDEPVIRIGHGYDIHRLIEGTPLVIGGVTIPFKLGMSSIGAVWWVCGGGKMTISLMHD
jgi:hypothetical protein